MQVAFYFRAKSIQIRANTAKEENNNKPVGSLLRRWSQNVGILTGIMSYFVVRNFALWIETSFVETRNSESSWENQYFDSWPVIYSIFNPVSLVFKALLQLRLEYDSSTIRAQHATTRYEVFSCARIRVRYEHPTRNAWRRVIQLIDS